MKAYVTSIGEKTTQICCDQLDKYGYEVVLLDKVEPWVDKYKRFIEMADTHCIRIDADVVVNKMIKEAERFVASDFLVVDFHTWDFYKNMQSVTSPIYYNELLLSIIRSNLDDISEVRPERSMTLLAKERKYTCEYIVGMHGFFQTKKHLKAAYENKRKRGQLEKYGYDFDLAERLWELK